MLKRRSNTQNISWFLDQASFGRLDLEPSYQRKSVWTAAYRKYFIDTVLNNFPCPSVFLNVEVKTDGTSLYHVIDGKQRLTTVLEFMKDRFKTAKTSSPEYADKYFSELTDDQKTNFYEYTFTVENISGADTALLNEAFDRLNRNVAKLTDQELRHAKFSGPFINLMETLAGDQLWRDIGIATPANIRRMRDIEFISEIFLLTMHGILEGKAEVLDKYYAEYDEGLPDEETHRENYELCKSYILGLNLPFKGWRFSNNADFYSLWAAILPLATSKASLNFDRSKQNLIRFMEEVNTVQEDSKNVTPEAFDYLNAVRQGSNKLQNRTTRANLLRECLIEL